jgi:energy-coupling factor transport system ATP-binding protein
MIEFENVGFTYDGSTFVLDDIDLQINQGEFVCVLGGNGSGKSTLAKHINALLVPDAGHVTVLDRDTSDEQYTYFIRSSAGMVFQNPDDQLVASLIENDVAFGPENLGVPTAELRERVTNALAQVGLQGFERKETAALSGGQKQRVAIAGVLAMNPQILILDEASAMLDPRGRKGLLRVCKELHAAGMTIVMITHFMEEAALADRVFVLDDGHVALEGTPDSVLTRMELLESLALDIPFGVKVSRALQQRGVPVALHVSEDDLAAELLQMFGTAESPADGSVHAEGGPA